MGFRGQILFMLFYARVMLLRWQRGFSRNGRIEAFGNYTLKVVSSVMLRSMCTCVVWEPHWKGLTRQCVFGRAKCIHYAYRIHLDNMLEHQCIQSMVSIAMVCLFQSQWEHVQCRMWIINTHVFFPRHLHRVFANGRHVYSLCVSLIFIFFVFCC